MIENAKIKMPSVGEVTKEVTMMAIQERPVWLYMKEPSQA
jgi:hypothetical protein